ncbi:Apc13p-domain-containing protein [Corynespora cassiicola Philippines]|uniref:Apc13p-domain-containing protein n=1 Tax=Corynespora cassiicola Philippines TaxID=1448308 RepID=A0A2T2N1R8_CORCC|nr:Apc13p-domain-containing protein [Corynespora cassiicola Philippines]
MTRDSTATYLHMHHSHHADLLESFTHPTSSHLAPEDIFVPPHLQPLNPEDEDDVVPDQHAAFGIQRATQSKREASWRDLGLEELVRRAPAGEIGAGGAGGSSAQAAMGGASAGAGPGIRSLSTVPRRHEPVILSLRRRFPGGLPGGTRVQGADMQGGAGGGRGVGNGLPR